MCKIMGPHFMQICAPLLVLCTVTIICKQGANQVMPIQNHRVWVLPLLGRLERVVGVSNTGRTVFSFKELPAKAMNLRSVEVPADLLLYPEAALEQRFPLLPPCIFSSSL